MTRDEIINSVKLRIDELTPIDGLVVDVGLEEDKPIDAFISGLLDECAIDVLMHVDISRIDVKSLNADSIGHDDGSGHVALPDDFIRLAKFKMTEWQRPVYEFATGALAHRQHNIYTRGGISKPVCVMGHRGGKRVLEYYSVKKNHTIEDFQYVPRMKAEDLNNDVLNVLIWICASKVLTIVGKINEANAAHKIAMSL